MFDTRLLAPNRLSFCQLSTSRWSLEEDLCRYKTLGFDSLGIWRSKIEDLDVEKAIQLVNQSEMSVSSLHWAGGFTGSEGKRLADAMNDAVEAIRLAKHLNAGCLIVHPGARNGHTSTHVRRLFTQSLEKLLPVAEIHDVVLAIEPVLSPNSEWTFLRKFQENVDLLNQFDHPNFQMALDLFHVGLNRDTFDRLHHVADRLALVQLADRFTSGSAEGEMPWYANQRQPLGRGDVEIQRWVNRLESLGYKGKYEIELPGVSMDSFQLLDHSYDYIQALRVGGVKNTNSQSPLKADAANQ